MRILITGGAGFIGSAVVRMAIESGHSVVNVDALTYAACLENLASISENPNYSFEHADIRDRDGLDLIFKYKIARVATSSKIKIVNKIVSMIRKLYYKVFLWNYI